MITETPECWRTNLASWGVLEPTQLLPVSVQLEYREVHEVTTKVEQFKTGSFVRVRAHLLNAFKVATINTERKTAMIEVPLDELILMDAAPVTLKAYFPWFKVGDVVRYIGNEPRMMGRALTVVASTPGRFEAKVSDGMGKLVNKWFGCKEFRFYKHAAKLPPPTKGMCDALREHMDKAVATHGDRVTLANVPISAMRPAAPEEQKNPCGEIALGTDLTLDIKFQKECICSGNQLLFGKCICGAQPK